MLSSRRWRPRSRPTLIEYGRRAGTAGPTVRGEAMDIPVEVVSDVIRPWCFVGKRRLERAVGLLDGRHAVRVAWRPFRLNPQMPREGMDRRAYRTAKFGSWEKSLALEARVEEVGRAEGIPFAFARIAR